MGNSSSTEQPRRAGQKLSKPRVGNHASSPNPSGTNNVSQLNNAHYSNSYVVGSPAPGPEPPVASPSVQELPFDGSRGSGGAADGHNQDVKPNGEESPSPVVQPEQQDVPRRSSSGLAERSSSSTRRRSVVQPLARATSWAPRENRHSAVYDGPPLDLQKSASKQSLVFQDSSDDKRGGNDVPSLHGSIGVHSQSTGHLPLNRTQSEASLYAPPRRRSSNQTPGVATRVEDSTPVLSRKSSFRHSLPATPSTSVENPFEAQAKRRMSLPLHVMPAHERERISTPTEADYKQLGGMKFGSLRIMNGTPTSSHGPERDHLKAFGMLGAGHPSVLVSQHEIGSDGHHLTGPDETVKVVIAHPKPVSGALSPAVANFSDIVTEMVHHSPDYPSSSGSSSSHEGVGDSDTTPMSSIASSTDADTLSPPTVSSSGHTAKGSIELEPRKSLGGDSGSRVESSQKSVRSIARSEGSFSMKSSKSSKKQQDSSSSGHRSRLSLRSLRGLKSRKSEDKGSEAESQGSQERRPSLKQTGPFQSSSLERQSGLPPGAPPVPALPQTKPHHSDSPHTRPVPGQALGHVSASEQSNSSPVQGAHHVSPAHVHPKNETSASVNAATRATASGEVEGQKVGKLSRLVSNARRKSLPPMPAAKPYNEDAVAIPVVPATETSEASVKPDTRATLKRRSLRIEPNKPTSFSIITREDKEKSRETVGMIPNEHLEGVFYAHSSQKASDMGRTTSFLSTKRNSHRNSILRMPSMSSRKTRADSNMIGDEDIGVDDVLLYDSPMGSIDSIRRSVGNSAFDQAFVPMTEDYGMQRIHAGHQPGQPNRRWSSGPSPYPPLRSRSSAPDFLETVMEPASPGGTDSASQKKPKTPPPVSIRTRGSKKSRRKRSSSQHHPEVPPLPSQYAGMPPIPNGRISRSNYPSSEDLSQSLRSIPVHSYSSPHIPGVSHGPNQGQHQSGQRHASHRPTFADSMASYHHARSQSHHIPRPDHRTAPPPDAHRLARGAGPKQPDKGEASDPPFRVLHSYNSPAYRNVPIWAT